MQAELWASASEQPPCETAIQEIGASSQKASAGSITVDTGVVGAGADSEARAESALASDAAATTNEASKSLLIQSTIQSNTQSNTQRTIQSTFKKAAARERARAAGQHANVKQEGEIATGAVGQGQKKVPESLNSIITRRDTWIGRGDLDYRLAEPSIDSAKAANAANNDLHYHQQIPTGFAPLDARLCEQGWPLGTCIEVMSDASGMGAMGLFLPAMEKLNRQQRWQAFIAPPYAPYAPLLAARGIDTEQVLLVHPQDREEILWSTEQALRSGTCSAVFSWLGAGEYRYAELRRLQLAAARGNTLAVLFRSQDAAHQHAPAALRLQMSAYRQVHILKQRSGLQGIDVYLPPEDDIPNQPQLWELPRDMAGNEARAAC